MRRQCGDCSLCCKLLPVPEFNKPSGERCQHQRHSVGCNIYPRRPHACRLWNCRWLAGDDTGSRPDHAHYVVDVMPDYITMVPHDGSEPIKAPVIQVWLDPKYPDAHRDPRLRAFLERERMPALIRLNERDGFVLAPPNVNSDGTWFEGQNCISIIEPSRTIDDKIKNMGPLNITLELKDDPR